MLQEVSYTQAGTSFTTASSRPTSRVANQYLATDATVASRFRGRLDIVTRYASAGTSTGAVVEMDACTVADVPYGSTGSLECWEVPQTPTALRITERTTAMTTASGPSAIGTRETVNTSRVRAAGTILAQTYRRAHMNGVEIESGTVGGNYSRGVLVGGLTNASKETLLSNQTEYDAAGVMLRKTVNDYDAFGRLEVVRSYKGSTTLQSEIFYTYDAATGNVASETRTITTSPLASTLTTYDYDIASGGHTCGD